ncbi:MAG: FAD-binding oxidoreductase, partial [Novosphingobium sp.]
SKLVQGWSAVQALFASRADEMAALGVNAGAMLAAVSPQVCLIEPVFFWPEELNPLHRHAVEPAHLAKLKGFAANAASTALVAELRAGVVAEFQKLGAVHLQIARTYPLKDGHSPASWDLLKSLKVKVDPKGLMNPGSLGL